MALKRQLIDAETKITKSTIEFEQHIQELQLEIQEMTQNNMVGPNLTRNWEAVVNFWLSENKNCRAL